MVGYIKKESVELISVHQNGGCGKTRIKQTYNAPHLDSMGICTERYIAT